MTKLQKALFAAVVAIVSCIGAAIIATYGNGGDNTTQIAAGLLSLAGLSVTNLLGSIKSSQALEAINAIAKRLDDHISATTVTNEAIKDVAKAVETATNTQTVVDATDQPAQPVIKPDLSTVGAASSVTPTLVNTEQLESA